VQIREYKKNTIDEGKKIGEGRSGADENALTRRRGKWREERNNDRTNK
jgi:hypothetical protein